MLDALLASLADAVYLVGPAGDVRFLNPAALTVLGYERPEELLGADSHATIHHHHPDGSVFPAAECPMLRPRTTGETVRVDQDWFVRRDGSFVPVSYASAPVSTPEGRGAVVVFRDISDRLEADEVAASRTRLVVAAADERRRIGRDLHDGAQQRLVQALIRIEQGDLEAAGEETRRALRDLRELAAGIHPSVLTDHGLAAAIEDLTATSAIPVVLDLDEARHPADVEAAGYFFVAEALANVAKHAHAGRASVTVRGGEELVITVHDDGRGGADLARGTGLRGLQDRLAALGGRLELVAGHGTTLRATIPRAAP